MTGAAWRPDGGLEQDLLAARETGDPDAYLRRLARADLLLPLLPEEAAAGGPVSWVIAEISGTRQVLAFTSTAAMRRVLDEDLPHRVARFVELADTWPDPALRLAVDPGLPVEAFLGPEAVRAAAEAAAEAAAQPARGGTVVAGLLDGAVADLQQARALRAELQAQGLRELEEALRNPVDGVPDAAALRTADRVARAASLIEPRAGTVPDHAARGRPFATPPLAATHRVPDGDATTALTVPAALDHLGLVHAGYTWHESAACDQYGQLRQVERDLTEARRAARRPAAADPAPAAELQQRVDELTAARDELCQRIEQSRATAAGARKEVGARLRDLLGRADLPDPVRDRLAEIRDGLREQVRRSSAADLRATGARTRQDEALRSARAGDADAAIEAARQSGDARLVEGRLRTIARRQAEYLGEKLREIGELPVVPPDPATATLIAAGGMAPAGTGGLRFDPVADHDPGVPREAGVVGRWRAGAATDVGGRSGNQDGAYHGLRLAAVADGMGGHAGGARASHLVLAELVRLLDTGEPPADPVAAARDAVHAANQRLYEENADLIAARDAAVRAARTDPGRVPEALEAARKVAGTTLTALLIVENEAVLVHVGDTRAYRLRNGVLAQLTEDHSTSAGELTSALDGSQARVQLVRLVVRPGDRYLLATDGLHGELARVRQHAPRDPRFEVPGTAARESVPATFERLLSEQADPQEAVDALLNRIRDEGGSARQRIGMSPADNATAVVVDVPAPGSSPADGPPARALGTAEGIAAAPDLPARLLALGQLGAREPADQVRMVADFWHRLTPEHREALVQQVPELVSRADGIDVADRARATAVHLDREIPRTRWQLQARTATLESLGFTEPEIRADPPYRNLADRLAALERLREPVTDQRTRQLIVLDADPGGPGQVIEVHEDLTWTVYDIPPSRGARMPVDAVQRAADALAQFRVALDNEVREDAGRPEPSGGRPRPVPPAEPVSSGLPRVGEWVIEPGVPGDGTPPGFDQMAREMVAAFLGAFGDVVRVDSARADLLSLAADGQATGGDESVPVAVDEDGRLVTPPGAGPVAGVYLSCALWVHTSTGSRWCPDGVRFVYWCTVEYDDAGLASMVDASVVVTVGVDAWSGQTGAVNRRLLAGALRDWERRAGSPITGWFSSAHPGEVGRHGFADLG